MFLRMKPQSVYPKLCRIHFRKTGNVHLVSVDQGLVFEILQALY